MLEPADDEDSWFPVDFDESAPSAPSASSEATVSSSCHRTPPTLCHALKLHGGACSWTRCCPRWRRVLLLLGQG